VTTTARRRSAVAVTVGVLSALYFAQGLPFGFFTQALPVVLRESGFSLIEISATGLLFAPWALKFLWAPFVDRYGTRRRWLLSLQFACAAVACLMASFDVVGGYGVLFVGIAVLNTLSATQDVATDGVAVTRLGPRQRGLGNGIQVGAYRIGMIAGGGGLLYLYAVVGWRGLFLAMALALVLCTIPVWWLPRERVSDHRESHEGPTSFLRTAGTWLERLRRPGVVGLIALIAAYKFGDSMGSALTGPFMTDVGMSLLQIALVKGVLSSAGALVGAALGGWIAYRYGRRTALLLGGLTQTVALGLYLTAALGVGGFGLIVAASLAEHIFGGAATVAVFTVMMDAAERAHAGADYTLLACSVVVVQGVAGLAAGLVGQLWGYPALFGSSLLISGIGCVVLILALDRGAGTDGVRVGYRLRW
jgi:MFS family permease